MNMKSILTLIFTSITSLALAHEGVELGPNGGRILEFSKDETLHGELTVDGGHFKIALLDGDLKPVAVDQQVLTAITGDRSSPQRLDVKNDSHGFSIPTIKEGDWLILQFKNDDAAKAITARFEYNTANCEGCNAPEWLCKCKPEDEEKK